MIIVINGYQVESLYKRLFDLYGKLQNVILVKSDFKYLNENLNIGLRASSGKYIARMDSDDISINTRLEIQVNYLDNNQSIGLVASNFEYSKDRISQKVGIGFTHPMNLKTSDLYF